MCQSCGEKFKDGEEGDWIGFYRDCGRWFHYLCAGSTRKPRQSTSLYVVSVTNYN